MDILIKSLVSAFVVAAVLLTTRLLNPNLGGLLSGIPLVFFLSLTFATDQGKSNQVTDKFLTAGVWSAVFFFVFAFSLRFLISELKWGFWKSIAVCYVVWLVLAFTHQALLNRT